MNCFPDKLHFEDVGLRNESRIFCLLSDFRYISSAGVITVPAGFETDGASVPKVFWALFAPFGPYFHAAVIHDYLYSNHNSRFTRLESDLLFKEAMYNSGVRAVTREIVFNAVRAFGKRFFNGKK